MAQKPRQQAQKRQPLKKRRTHWIKNLIDSYSLTIALVVELAITMISFWIIAPDTLTGIGFVAIASIVVLFAVRSWMKSLTSTGVERAFGRTLWASFAIVALFFNLSFAIATTETQTVQAEVRVTLDDDTVLERLDARLAEARVTRRELNEQYDGAVRESTVASLLAQLSRAEETITRLEDQVRIREQAIVTGEASEQAQREAQQLTANRIFYAIPTAVEQSRWIELIVFFFIFLGLELTIIMAIAEQNTGGSTNEAKTKGSGADIKRVYRELQSLADAQRSQGELLRELKRYGGSPANVQAGEAASAVAVHTDDRQPGAAQEVQDSGVLEESDAATTASRTRAPVPTKPVQERIVTRAAPIQHRNTANDVKPDKDRQSRPGKQAVAHALLASFLDVWEKDGYSNADDSAAVTTAGVLSDPAILDLLARQGYHANTAKAFLSRVWDNLRTVVGPSGYKLVTKQGKYYKPNYSKTLILETLAEKLKVAN